MAPAPIDVSTLRQLYTTPPVRFVEERTRLVKELRAAKDREGAAALGKLRKPSLADWALNVVVADHGADVAAFLHAAGTVRDAQAAAIEGRDGPDVRDALRDLREHSGKVLTRAQAVLSGAGRDAAAEAGTLASRLTEVSASAEASAQLAAGVLGSSLVVAEEVFAGLEPAAAGPAPRRRPARSVSPKAPSSAESVTQTAKARQRAVTEARRERDAAAKALARAEAAAEKAAAAVRSAERQLDRSRDALAAADGERDTAASRLAEAEASLQRAADRS